jgi:hypothetical protein
MSESNQTLDNGLIVIPDLMEALTKQPSNITISSAKQVSVVKDYDQMTETEKGNYIVDWIMGLLLPNDEFSEVINTSNLSSNIYDIIVRTKNDNCLRGLQVKTLIKRKSAKGGNGPDSWFIHTHDCSYPPETLMILVNKDKTRFALTYWKNISHLRNKLSMSFTSQAFKHKDIKYTDTQIFQKQLIVMAQQSVIIDEIEDGITSARHLDEYTSILNIRRVAISKGVEFKYDLTGGVIDILLAELKVQCKFSAYQSVTDGMFHFGLHRGGKQIPYKQSDNIDCFTFQVKDISDPDKYNNDVCNIPIQFLIEKGYIATDTQKGLKSINIPPPDCPRLHWTMPFWNNFDIFSDINQMKDSIHLFKNKYKCIIKNVSKRKTNIYTFILTQSDTTADFDYLIVNTYDKEETMVSPQEKIFVIHKQSLIDLGYYKPNCRRSVSIMTPDYHDNHWSLKYWTELEDLQKLSPSTN